MEDVKPIDKKQQSGQVFFEFILLLTVLTILSYALLHGVNSNVADRWQAMVHLITQTAGQAPPELN